MREKIFLVFVFLAIMERSYLTVEHYKQARKEKDADILKVYIENAFRYFSGIDERFDMSDLNASDDMVKAHHTGICEAIIDGLEKRFDSKFQFFWEKKQDATGGYFQIYAKKRNTEDDELVAKIQEATNAYHARMHDAVYKIVERINERLSQGHLKAGDFDIELEDLNEIMERVSTLYEPRGFRVTVDTMVAKPLTRIVLMRK